MGIDPADAIRYFGSRKQIYEIHFRNVSSPLPHFHETTWITDITNMYQIIKALVDVKYDGIVHLGTIPFRWSAEIARTEAFAMVTCEPCAARASG